MSQVNKPGFAWSCSFSNVSPAVSTMNAVMRRAAPVTPSGNAKSTIASAIVPFEIKYFTPLSRNLSPSRR
ncbi:MAG: hypothetical protein DWI20_00085 [Planctomycetota bacterium]|nr:MAG: hypothetical protein DWI20_00085 [Planctomycetota bacterium]